ncbi:MAG TPA: hypothetical protein VGK19_08515 [Capsulimonadaceae bacterium]|jgi:hypothetical protein
MLKYQRLLFNILAVGLCAGSFVVCKYAHIYRSPRYYYFDALAIDEWIKSCVYYSLSLIGAIILLRKGMAHKTVLGIAVLFLGLSLAWCVYELVASAVAGPLPKWR